MRFLGFGNKDNPSIVLTHGFGITWRMWMKHIEEFSKEYYVIAAVLDGMDDENTSDFISVEKSSEDIIRYVKENLDSRVFAICGVSLGGTIAIDVLARNEIKVEKAIIDGAPVVPFSSIFMKFSIMLRKWQTKKLAQESKFLINPLKKVIENDLVDEYIKLSKFLTKTTIENVHLSAFSYTLPNAISETKTEISYWYGSKETFICKKSISKIKEKLPNAHIKVFEGCNHGEACMIYYKLYIEKALEFFRCENKCTN